MLSISFVYFLWAEHSLIYIIILRRRIEKNERFAPSCAMEEMNDDKGTAQGGSELIQIRRRISIFSTELPLLLRYSWRKKDLQLRIILHDWKALEVISLLFEEEKYFYMNFKKFLKIFDTECIHAGDYWS